MPDLFLRCGFAFATAFFLPLLRPWGTYVNMADIKRPANPLFLRDEELRQVMELLYFAYRTFMGEADGLLNAQGYGRAHHRVLYFVGREPGMTVKQLLALLEISKQSLAPVLKALVSAGLVEQRPGDQDKRVRHLHLSPAGIALEQEVVQAQIRLLREKFLTAGPVAVDGFRSVLLGLVPVSHKKRFS